MNNKIAIIDMGTNTFHLLIVELEGQQYKIVHQERLAVKIGVGGINEGRITEEGENRALVAIQNFKTTLQKFAVKNVMAFGTSAFRNAKNGLEVTQKIKFATGIETQIISGDEEARFIYRGVRSGMNLGDQKSLIVDIGGGSVEFIIGNEKEFFWKQSFEIGAQRLLEKYQKHDPILSEEIEALTSFLQEALRPLFKAMEIHQPKTLVGSSGTFDTLSDIHCVRNNIQQKNNPETPLTINSFYEIFDEFKIKNREERLLIHGMIEMRVDMIVVACCLINFLLQKHQFTSIRVSRYSLKEGVLASL
ncbi:MAG: exopolyphosphatase [Bacteroidia bacterium]|nr:exopolyphosphatase [Bacteroidia bacterium]